MSQNLVKLANLMIHVSPPSQLLKAPKMMIFTSNPP